MRVMPQPVDTEPDSGAGQPAGTPDVPAGPARRRRRHAGVRDIVTGLREAVIFCIVGMVLVAVAPMLLRWPTTVVVSGSMAPIIQPGDVIAAAPAPSGKSRPVEPGAIVLVADPADPDRLVLHRLVRYDRDDRMILKGDANQTADSTPVPIENLKGVARLRVPFIGLPSYWIDNGRYLPVLAAAGLLLATFLWRPDRPPAR